MSTLLEESVPSLSPPRIILLAHTHIVLRILNSSLLCCSLYSLPLHRSFLKLLCLQIQVFTINSSFVPWVVSIMTFQSE